MLAGFLDIVNTICLSRYGRNLGAVNLLSKKRAAG
jgi:hypothetical protein